MLKHVAFLCLPTLMMATAVACVEVNVVVPERSPPPTSTPTALTPTAFAPTPSPVLETSTPLPLLGIDILRPYPAGVIVPVGDVEIDVMTFGSWIPTNKLDKAAVPGEGHFHFYLDVDQVPTTPGQPAFSAPGTYVESPTTTFVWRDVAPGLHRIAVQAVNNDHTPLDRPVVAETDFEAR